MDFYKQLCEKFFAKLKEFNYIWSLVLGNIKKVFV